MCERSEHQKPLSFAAFPEIGRFRFRFGSSAPVDAGMNSTTVYRAHLWCRFPSVLCLTQTCHSASPIGLQASRHPLVFIFVGDFRPVWMILFRYVYSNPDVELIPVLHTPICHSYIVSFNIIDCSVYIAIELFDSIGFIPLHRKWNIQSEETFHFQFRWKRKLLYLVIAV